MTIHLPSALDRMVRDKVLSGQFADETEVVCHALRSDMASDEVSSWIRAQAAEGFAQLDSGNHVDLTRDTLFAHLANRHVK